MPFPAVFADTNLLIYVRDGRDPAKNARAIQWHDHLWEKKTGRTSAQVISEYYVNLKRVAGPAMTAAEAWRDASSYLAWKPQAIDEEMLIVAREIESRYRVSWWDSLIVAAAQMQGCALLLTEDLQDGMAFGTVVVRSPFTLEVEESRATYAVAASLPSPHRPRGRPRRVQESKLNP